MRVTTIKFNICTEKSSVRHTPSVKELAAFLLPLLILGGNKLGPMTVAKLLVVIRFAACYIKKEVLNNFLVFLQFSYNITD